MYVYMYVHTIKNTKQQTIISCIVCNHANIIVAHVKKNHCYYYPFFATS